MRHITCGSHTLSKPFRVRGVRFSTGDETMNDEICFQVSSVNMCKWFLTEAHARKWYLYEAARPNAGAVCIKITSDANGLEKERTPHHFD